MEARKNRVSKKSKSDLELVVFTVAGEMFAIDIGYIEEIKIPPKITRIPHARPFVMGIATLRGKLFPVINFARLFNLPEQPETLDSRVIIFQFPEEMIGFYVDYVVGVGHGTLEEMVQVNEALQIDREYFNGFFPHKDKFISYLNLQRLLASDLFSTFYAQEKKSVEQRGTTFTP